MINRFFYLVLLSAFFVGCEEAPSSELPKVPDSESVSFKINFGFDYEGGSMLKSAPSTAAEQYNQFYEKYIKTRILTPSTFHLSFAPIGGQKMFFTDGAWKDNNVLTLPVGRYVVTGESKGSVTSHRPDTVDLVFQDTVNIDTNTQEITIKAEYGDYLLLFNDAEIATMSYDLKQDAFSVKQMMPKKDNLYYFFWSVSNGILSGNWSSNNAEFRLGLDGYKFEVGNYYYFQAVNNTLDIPPMGTVQ